MQAKLHKQYGKKTARTGFEFLDHETQQMIQAKLMENKEWERINGSLWFGYHEKPEIKPQTNDKDNQQPIPDSDKEKLLLADGKDAQQPNPAVQDPKLPLQTHAKDPPEPNPPLLDPELLLPAPDADSRKNWVTKFNEAKKAVDITRQNEVEFMIENNSYPVRTLMERS